MKKILLNALLISAIMMTVSCSDNDADPDPTVNLDLVTTVSIVDSDYSVRLYVPKGHKLEVGYCQYFLALYDENEEWMADAHFEATPMMQMMGDMPMQHSAPSESHPHAHDGLTLQSFATVFVMPTSEMGAWTLNVTVMDQATSFNGTATINLTITNPDVAKMKSFVGGANETSYFLSLVQPNAPEVGENDLEFTLHSRASMMSWPAVENLTIEIEPEMPSMGHGSPNNVHPAHDANGHYMGKVNFTMTGDWVINVVIKDGDTVIGETAFDITL